MKIHPRYQCFALAFPLFGPMLGHCGRPMTTDDSSILEVNTCQMEAWSQHSNSQTEIWAVPACNFNLDWELAAGIAQVRSRDERSKSRLAVLQAKTTFRALSSSGWGLGLVIAQQPAASGSLKGDTTINIPASLSFKNDSVLLHMNLGWVRQGITMTDGVTWAIGTELALGQRTAFMLESFGSKLSRTRIQTGFRYAVVSNRIDLDASYSRKLTIRGNDGTVSVGLTVVSSILR